jgi:hypothetical protein
MSKHFEVKYPGIKINPEEIEDKWQSFKNKFYPKSTPPLENFSSFQRVDKTIFKNPVFLAFERYYFVISHPLTDKMLASYIALPNEIAFFFNEYPFPKIDEEISIFSECVDWSIVNNHDGDIFLLGTFKQS